MCTIRVVSGGPASAHIKILIKFDEMDREKEKYRVCVQTGISQGNTKIKLFKSVVLLPVSPVGFVKVLGSIVLES